VFAKEDDPAPAAVLNIKNYPITGPVFSGPQEKPFICETNTFKLPDGSVLGAPTDANCSVETVVQYLYRSKTAERSSPLKPLTKGTALPNDVAMTTTSTGRTVPYIVRLETGDDQSCHLPGRRARGPGGRAAPLRTQLRLESAAAVLVRRGVHRGMVPSRQHDRRSV
jgi:hypothetical protein